VSQEHRNFFKRRVFYELAPEKDPFNPAMEPTGFNSLYNVDHPLTRLVRAIRGT
jgi:hypothetical protein